TAFRGRDACSRAGTEIPQSEGHMTTADVHATHEVRIHIDQKPYHSPTPTDGEALYALGNVKPGLELYREVSGNREDKPIPRSKEHVHLKQDDHFHSGEPHAKAFTIIVNLQKKTVTTKEVSFEQVVKLAFDPVPANSIFTVTY